MLLSDRSIKELLKKKRLLIEPQPVLKSASIRVHLSNQFAKPQGKIEKKESYILKPKKLVLSSTMERIKLPADHAALYDGSTTLARVGITSHMGSMFISPGSEGNLTLEIFNASDVSFTLKSGMRIGQLLILKLDSPVEHPQPTLSTYRGKKHIGLVLPDKKERNSGSPINNVRSRTIPYSFFLERQTCQCLCIKDTGDGPYFTHNNGPEFLEILCFDFRDEIIFPEQRVQFYDLRYFR
jgi:dCTP deaminase